MLTGNRFDVMHTIDIRGRRIR